MVISLIGTNVSGNLLPLPLEQKSGTLKPEAAVFSETLAPVTERKLFTRHFID
jgi:hypothetical protein